MIFVFRIPKPFLIEFITASNQNEQKLIRMIVDDDMRQVVQARAEPLLRSLNDRRRWSLVLFLEVMSLLAKDHPIISLAGADLRGVDEYGATLEEVDLAEADLRDAHLAKIHLAQSNLKGANLSAALLENASYREPTYRELLLKMPHSK